MAPGGPRRRRTYASALKSMAVKISGRCGINAVQAAWGRNVRTTVEGGLECSILLYTLILSWRLNYRQPMKLQDALKSKSP